MSGGCNLTKAVILKFVTDWGTHKQFALRAISCALISSLILSWSGQPHIFGGFMLTSRGHHLNF